MTANHQAERPAGIFNEEHVRETAKGFTNVPGVVHLELGTTLAGVKRHVSELRAKKFLTLICCMAASLLSLVFLLHSPSAPSIPTK